ncbi:MAG: phospholipase D-like domain-containing protein [Anaerolineales bacterium]|nr:phospholipase D-like domain-containing protein [Anaerolineales bacterium]
MAHRAVRALLFAAICLELLACQPMLGTATVPAIPTPAVAALKPIVQPESGVQPVVALLNSAQKTIRMEMYLLTEREIIDALKAARGRGVDVRVMLEPSPFGGGAGNRPALNDLQAAQINVKNSNPAYRLTHEKAIVVDERVALIATFNQTRAAFTANREYGIVDARPDDVAEIVSVFEADWKRVAPTLANPNLVWSPINARARLTALIDGAQQSLDIQTEEMQDRAIEDRLIAAAQRGVTVRVVMSPALSGVDANAPGQERIANGGVQVRLVKTPYIHAKLIVADGARAFVGSQNLSTASLDSNRELGILIFDPAIIRVWAETFAQDWNVGR